jgi:RNA polymerase sigma-70 factor (ECF subfamily)
LRRDRVDEACLIEQAKQGDKKAIGELYRRHIDAIYRYAYARVKDTGLAEDLTAQVFLKALEGLPRYRFTGVPFANWLYSIARARINDHWRRQRRSREVPLKYTAPAGVPGPEEYVAQEEDWAIALDLLAQLSDCQQEVILLRFIGEMSLSEVASTLGKSVGAVKALQHRALAALARLVERKGLALPA